MRLAFCIFKYFPFGGLQRDCLEIARTCRQHGHDVTLFTREWVGPVPQDIRVRIVPGRGLTNHARSFSFVAQVLPLLSRTSFDLVVGFNKMPGLDLYFAGDSCYAEQARHKHKFRWSPYYWATPRFRRYSALERAVFGPESQTEILLLAASHQRTFSTQYGTPPDRFHVLLPGICQDRIPPPNLGKMRSQLRDEFLREPEDRLLLAVGVDARRKGLDRTIHAMAALPRDVRARARLLAIGERHPLPFQRLADRLSVSDRITFLPPRADVQRFFCGADLLVHPAYVEPGGAVLLESIACGLPVLTTEVCGYADSVRAAQGGVVLPTPFEQSRMNHLLSELLTSPRLPELAKNARSFADSGSLLHRAAHIVKIIEARAERNKQRVSPP